jgi:hypothetical protein
MSAPTFTLKATPGRLDIECEACGTGMDSPDNPFGQAMVKSFADLHKCPKVKK